MFYLTLPYLNLFRSCARPHAWQHGVPKFWFSQKTVLRFSPDLRTTASVPPKSKMMLPVAQRATHFATKSVQIGCVGTQKPNGRLVCCLLARPGPVRRSTEDTSQTLPRTRPLRGLVHAAKFGWCPVLAAPWLPSTSIVSC